MAFFEKLFGSHAEEKKESSSEQDQQQLKAVEQRLENLKKWIMAGEGTPADATLREQLEQEIEKRRKALDTPPDKKE